MEKIISTNYMNKSDLKKLSKSQLIQLLLKQDLEMKMFESRNIKQNNNNIILPPPRKSVKEMVQG